MFSWYRYLIVSLVFSRLGFWSGNLLLIAPFPDRCLLFIYLQIKTFACPIYTAKGQQSHLKWGFAHVDIKETIIRVQSIQVVHEQSVVNTGCFLGPDIKRFCLTFWCRILFYFFNTVNIHKTESKIIYIAEFISLFNESN